MSFYSADTTWGMIQENIDRNLDGFLGFSQEEVMEKDPEELVFKK